MSAAERGPGGSGGPGGPAGPDPGGGRKARGRPRLTETDRARRRLESRKKYDVRRVYLGEAHGPWVELRRRSGWSDAKLAAYLLGLERGQRAGRRGKPWEQLPKKPKRKKRRRRNVNCLRHAVIWYEDHRQRCPYEPRLAELDPSVGLYTTAVWQCERGHRYFQDLHSPLRPLSDSDSDGDSDSDSDSHSGGDEARGSSSSSSSSSSSGRCSSGSEGAAAAGGGPAVPAPPPGGPGGPGGPAGGPEALEAVLCVPLGPPPALLQGPPLLILAGPLGGLQLELGGLLGAGGSFPAPPAEPHLPKTEEDEEDPVLRLKQEELPPPAQPPPPEPPRDPSPNEDTEGSTIIYEIPKEPERPRRSRRGRAPSPDPPEPLTCPHSTCGQQLSTTSSLQSQVSRRGRSQVCPQPGCGRSFHLENHLHRHVGVHSGEPQVCV
ncbi:zinc finger protein 653 [Oenanthe melanoleuca]|uniref:zinc finger protein 653 n=1 Tax=Oenanthe melanoleuca TaxID=2939378 RepID=UPI0024C1F26C|nr:zinc finger protein 653 [Oenanthe melanoleuca]